jgi:hypothetical protein
MNRAEQMRVSELLNLAIWVRDNVYSMDTEELNKQIMLLADYDMLSSRQISAIVNNKVSHSSISKMIGKNSKTGGNLNVGTLEILRNVLYSRSNGETDYGIISEALKEGTSQGMISKLTGVSQSSISRRSSGNK